MREARSPATLRAKSLRADARLEDEHVLCDRTLRNHLEHFDERLDEWAAKSKHRDFFQDLIGPATMISIPGADAADMMRWFDPSKAEMKFRGHVFPLQPMATAIEDIHDKCEMAIETIDREERTTRHALQERARALTVPHEDTG